VAKFFNLSQNEVDFIEKSVDRFYIWTYTISIVRQTHRGAKWQQFTIQ
jgi:hypothetical protein